MKLVYSIIGISLFFLSCEKSKLKKMTGSYHCQIYNYWYVPDTVLSDYFYEGNLLISIDDDMARCNGQSVGESTELLDGYAEWINPNGTWGVSYVRIKGDSVYSRIYEHYKFGNIKYKDYAGLKVE